MLPDASAPLVGKTTLTPADGDVLLKASASQFGFFSQSRLVRYYALAALLAAVFCIEGYDLLPKVMLGLALALFLLSIVAAFRTMRLVREGYGHGQEREIVMDDAGVTIREPEMTVVYAWSRFKRVTETANHLALVSGVGIVVVPKRAFDTATFARVLELIAAKGPAQKLR